MASAMIGCMTSSSVRTVLPGAVIAIVRKGYDSSGQNSSARVCDTKVGDLERPR